jgi:NSS family neurotransmitter:Na+ symporter
MTIFNNLDYLTSKIMLPLGGLLMALFVGYVMNKAVVKNELNTSQSIIDIWFMIIKIFSPILLIIIFIQGIL